MDGAATVLGVAGVSVGTSGALRVGAADSGADGVGSAVGALARRDAGSVGTAVCPGVAVDATVFGTVAVLVAVAGSSLGVALLGLGVALWAAAGSVRSAGVVLSMAALVRCAGLVLWASGVLCMGRVLSVGELCGGGGADAPRMDVSCDARLDSSDGALGTDTGADAVNRGRDDAADAKEGWDGARVGGLCDADATWTGRVTGSTGEDVGGRDALWLGAEGADADGGETVGEGDEAERRGDDPGGEIVGEGNTFDDRADVICGGAKEGSVLVGSDEDGEGEDEAGEAEDGAVGEIVAAGEGTWTGEDVGHAVFQFTVQIADAVGEVDDVEGHVGVEQV